MIDDTAVKVVVRIRPQISRDIIDLCHVCTRTIPNEPQIWIGNDKSYTFDHVFDMPTPQDDIFECVVKDLVDGCFDGYNATVLAYGQTGSGKTYTMGTGFDNSFNLDERGIIPRAVEHLFRKISEIQDKEKEKGCTSPEFNVHAQFMELYNEEVVDLLDTTRELDNKNKKTHVRIHEDADGKIYTHGVIAQCVTNVQEALHCLKIGSLSRTTASTGMNTQSSRSHAIFTLHIKQKRMTKPGKISTGGETCNSLSHKHSESMNEVETLTAKFHFVDLAGSERLKRTGATGDRQKESICINSGLLALGNVISALGDKSKKATHIPYRDSKLTRLLQDSLGGNSRTLMIACVSPSDRDFVETLSTLKYANRAKNIRNKVTANKDKSSQTINALIRQVESLQIELMEFRQGKRIFRDGVDCINDMYHENTMLQSENNSLKMRIKAQQQTIDALNAKNAQLEAEKRCGEWSKNIGDGNQSDIPNLVLGYVSEIESLRAKLIESENSNAILRKNSQKASPQYAFNPTSTVAITGHYDIRIDTATSVTDIIEEARKNVKKLKRKERKLKGEKETGEKANEEEDEKENAEEGENMDESADEEDSSSESESEKADNEQKLSENVADITCDISLKEKLIQMLEMSQRRIHNMKNYYEDKLAQLQTKILEAEKERDKTISNLNKNSGSKSEERKIRADYEKKISSLKNDVQQFENAKRNHAQLLSSASESEAKLKKLRQEVAEMKRAKVALLGKMKEEAKKFRESEQKRNKEIAQLKKEKQTKETQIRALEAEKKRKDLVLKRRADEIQNLKKKVVVKYISPKNASRLKSGPFQHKLAKQRWQQLENKINKLVVNRQNVAAIERDMDRWLKEREKIGRCLDKLTKKKEKAVFENKSLHVVTELEDEIESLKANIEYIHENLSECQTAITGLEEAKEQINTEDIISALNNMPLEESYYLIEKIVLLAIDQSFQNSQKEIMMKELESHLAQVIENNAVQEQLLFHVVQQANEHLAGYIELTANPETSDHSDNESESRSSSPNDSVLSFSREPTFVSDKQRKRKARNQPVTTEQLLFSSENNSALNESSDYKSLVAVEPPIPQDSMAITSQKSLSYVVLPAPTEDYNGNTHSQFTLPSKEEMPAVLGFKPIIANSGRQSSYLFCSHIVKGHDQAVMCVECTDDVLFSGSEDGLIKIWDLASNTEIQKMNHISAVKKVCYCEYTRRAFSASASAVKLWDVRQNPSSCTHTFWASGQLRKIKNPSLGPEYEINDISLNQYGTILYSASARSVQIFDLRMLQCIGALDVGYKSNVLCLVVHDTDFEKNRIICGSEDKAIKVFEIKEDDYGLHQPKYSLSTLHTDGVQVLALNDNALFSGSRDKSIRKWNLETKQAEYIEHNAHDDWICALNVLNGRNQIISGCKSGILKLWSMDRFKKLEEIKGHQSSINAISSNNSLVFTASNDCTIGVWKMKTAANSRFGLTS